MVEQGTHNPKATGSNPGRTTCARPPPPADPADQTAGQLPSRSRLPLLQRPAHETDVVQELGVRSMVGAVRGGQP